MCEKIGVRKNPVPAGPVAQEARTPRMREGGAHTVQGASPCGSGSRRIWTCAGPAASLGVIKYRLCPLENQCLHSAPASWLTCVNSSPKMLPRWSYTIASVKFFFFFLTYLTKFTQACGTIRLHINSYTNFPREVNNHPHFFLASMSP